MWTLWVRLPGSCILAGTMSAAIAQKTPPQQLLELSIEELSNIQVTSASRRPEPLSEAASAIFVITANDIRRSGATSIPEALRLAPGLHVARLDARRWAISARGFNGEFANKLLVQIDGRSVYTPVHSGVNWDVQDVLLEDVERIEVIRGPGATQWGANAVNGVINIITKSAHETRGGYLTAGAGTEQRGWFGARWDDALGDYGSYRVYGKYFRRDESDLPDDAGGGADDWWQGRVGFRADWNAPGPDRFRLSGDLYQAGISRLFPVVTSSPAEPSQPQWRDNRNRGGNLLGSWTHEPSETNKYSLQAYVDWTEADPLIVDERVITFDIDFQNDLRPSDDHHVVWGVGYRRIRDDFDNEFTVAFDPSSRTTDLVSAFVQDSIRLSDTVSLTLGSKLEHNDYSGGEIQPSVRIVWVPNESHTVWGAISRAVRTPSRAESDVTIQVVQPGPTVVRYTGNPALDAERLVAYELGYRVSPTASLFVDATIFHHDYDNLVDVEAGTPFVESDPPPTHTVLPATFVNRGEAEARGLEVAARWQASRRWRLDLTYSYLKVEQSAASGDTEGNNPRHQAGLFSQFDLTDTVQLDGWLRHVDDLGELGISDYTELDLRFGWKVRPATQLSLVGQNLLDAEHREFSGGTGIERSLYARIEQRF